LPRDDNEKLSWFKNRLAATFVIRLYPPSMTAESVEESRIPASGFENFVSWYRHVSQEYPKQQLSLFRDLEDSLDGFERLKLSASGASSRILEVVFSNQKNGETVESTYRFDELSDGQRAIVVLYALIRFAVNPDTTVFIDEPGNHLGLDEIQPWLLEVEEASSDAGSQVGLVSHHPELIDELALERGTLFYRDNAGPARTRPFETTSVGSIRVSERMARGWLDG
jgi:ATPase subunit of ABC transporter with duplicated ATPase domains